MEAYDQTHSVFTTGGDNILDALAASGMAIQFDLDLQVRDITPHMAAMLGFKDTEALIGRDLLYLFGTEDWTWLPWSTGERGLQILTDMIEEACDIGSSHREVHFITPDQHCYRGLCNVFFHEESGVINMGYTVGDPVNSTETRHLYGCVSISAEGEMVGANGKAASQQEMRLLQMYLKYDRETCLKKTGDTARTFERKIRRIAEKAGFESTTDLVRALALGTVTALPNSYNTIRLQRPLQLLNSHRSSDASALPLSSFPRRG